MQRYIGVNYSRTLLQNFLGLGYMPGLSPRAWYSYQGAYELVAYMPSLTGVSPWVLNSISRNLNWPLLATNSYYRVRPAKNHSLTPTHAHGRLGAENGSRQPLVYFFAALGVRAPTDESALRIAN